MSLVVRDHQSEDGTYSTATFSDCGDYRYALTRRWSNAPSLTYVMLNPSKADEKANDPTIARCEKRARLLGFGGISIANLFAFRATDPADLKKANAPVGPENEACVRAAVHDGGMTLAAWGVHGEHLGQDRVAISWLEGHPLHVLGMTRHGHPRHPLYISFASKPMPWTPPEVING